MKPFVFVYHKNGEVKCLNFEQSHAEHSYLIQQEWEHTATLDAAMWITVLANIADANDRLAMIDDIKIDHEKVDNDAMNIAIRRLTSKGKTRQEIAKELSCSIHYINQLLSSRKTKKKGTTYFQ